MRRSLNPPVFSIAFPGRSPRITLVYARAFPFSDELTQENADAYRAKHGFAPKVLIHGDRIYGLGKTEKNAGLALLFRSGWCSSAQAFPSFWQRGIHDRPGT